MLLAVVYQMKNCYPENILLACNGIRIYFLGCICQRWGVCVRPFQYQYTAKMFFLFADNWGNGVGCSFPCMALISNGIRSLFYVCNLQRLI